MTLPPARRRAGPIAPCPGPGEAGSVDCPALYICTIGLFTVPGWGQVPAGSLAELGCAALLLRGGFAWGRGGMGLDSFPALPKAGLAMPRLTKAIIKTLPPAEFQSVPWGGVAGGDYDSALLPNLEGVCLLEAAHGSGGKPGARVRAASRRRMGLRGWCPPQPKWAWVAGMGSSPVTSSSSMLDKFDFFFHP